MRIGQDITNATAVSLRYLSAANAQSAEAQENLASGIRLTHAWQGAAELQISTGLTSQIRGNYKAIQNLQDGVSLIGIADQTLVEIGDLLQRSRELLLQMNNGTISQEQFNNNEEAFKFLVREINPVAKKSNFNGTVLFDGNEYNSAEGYYIQTGPNASDRLNIQSYMKNMKTAVDGLNLSYLLQAGSLNTPQKIGGAITEIDRAMDKVLASRGEFGALQNRLEGQVEQLYQGTIAYEAAQSRLEDTDIAAESLRWTNSQIRQQAASTALNNAINIQRNTILQLLQP